MLTSANFAAFARRVYDFAPYPAAKYKILADYLRVPIADPALSSLRDQFLRSDVVEELYQAQSPDGNWGPLSSKDYAAKDPFPTTYAAIERCLYLGLRLEDRGMLLTALDYLEDILRGRSSVRLYNKNERAIPWQLCDIATWVERLSPFNPLVDPIYSQWLFIAGQTFADGEYSYDRDMAAQHELLGTREKRLVPLPVSLLLTRPAELGALNDALLRHYGQQAFLHGHFWDKNLLELPDNWAEPHTRRYFHTINYINQFYHTEDYLAQAMDWLENRRGADGLWDYGPQIKDPWGYFGYWSKSKQHAVNRALDCSMEVLRVFDAYRRHNGGVYE